MTDVIDRQALWRHAEAISRWRREAGTEDERRAFTYIHEQLRALGLDPELRAMPAYISLPGPAELRIAGVSVPAITHAMASPTPSGGVRAPAVGAGDDRSAWRGAVVVFGGLAGAAAVQAAERAGARAALFVNADRVAHEMIVSSVWGSPSADDLEALPSIPVVSVASGHAERIALWTASGAEVVLHAEVDTAWRDIPLLTVDIAGAADPDDQLVLLSGHVDSWHHGAMDNGGANAAMLEIARVAVVHGEALRRRLRIAFWSGHSHGRYAGSAWYVDQHFDELHRHCVVHVNVDSIGGLGASVLSSAPSMPCTYAVGAEAVRAVGGQELAPVRFGRAGDQSLFNLGVPSLFLTLSEQPADGEHRLRDAFGNVREDILPSGGLGWWWHTEHDTLDKLDPAILHRDTGIYWHAVRALLTPRVVPLDVVAAAQDVARHLTRLRERAEGRLDLAALEARAERVCALALEADERARALIDDDLATDHDVQCLNAGLVRALRSLTRIAYAAGDPFEHDRTTAAGPIPALGAIDELLAATGDATRAHPLRTALTRGRNRVSSELDQAITALEALTDRAARHA